MDGPLPALFTTIHSCLQLYLAWRGHLVNILIIIVFSDSKENNSKFSASTLLASFHVSLVYVFLNTSNYLSTPPHSQPLQHSPVTPS